MAQSPAMRAAERVIEQERARADRAVGERDEARLIVKHLVEAMGDFSFDRAMREHHIAARHIREWADE